MGWHDFGAGAVAAISAAATAAGHHVDPAEVTVGEAAAECADGVGILAWISGLEEDPDAAPCLWVPPVLWTIRLVACLGPLEGAEAWNELLELGWCAVTDYVDECGAQPNPPLRCDQVRFRGMNVLQPSGNMIHADYTWRVEDGCEASDDD